MNAIQKTRFYLFMSLVARAASIAFYGIGIFGILVDLGLFIFTGFAFAPSFFWTSIFCFAAGWVEGWFAKTLVKQYGLRA